MIQTDSNGVVQTAINNVLITPGGLLAVTPYLEVGTAVNSVQAIAAGTPITIMLIYTCPANKQAHVSRASMIIQNTARDGQVTLKLRMLRASTSDLMRLTSSIMGVVTEEQIIDELLEAGQSLELRYVNQDTVAHVYYCYIAIEEFDV